MTENIDGKVVVITGASSGLGEATARHLTGRCEARARRAAARSAAGTRRRARPAQRGRGPDRRHRPRAGQAAGRSGGRLARAHRRDRQQCRPDAALATRARQGGRLGPDDRRQSQGRAVWHRCGAAAHDPPEERPHHQRVLGGRPQGAARQRGLCGDQGGGAHAVGGAAPGGEALQHQDHDRLAGCGPNPSCRERHRARRRQGIQEFYEGYAIPADRFARMVAFAISQPDEVDINEILFRPTAQEL